MKLLIAIMTMLSVSAFAKSLPTATYVDVNQYVGKWYTITSLPQFFTRKCVGQTADYAIKTKNSISVLNTCIKKNGATETINGQAVVVNSQTNAELEVTFNSFWTKLFRVKGDYNILKLDPNYNVVLVGSNDLKSMWILARTPYLDDATKTEYLEYAKSLGFDASKFEDSHY